MLTKVALPSINGQPHTHSIVYIFLIFKSFKFLPKVEYLIIWRVVVMVVEKGERLQPKTLNPNWFTCLEGGGDGCWERWKIATLDPKPYLFTCLEEGGGDGGCWWERRMIKLSFTWLQGRIHFIKGWGELVYLTLIFSPPTSTHI